MTNQPKGQKPGPVLTIELCWLQAVRDTPSTSQATVARAPVETPARLWPAPMA